MTQNAIRYLFHIAYRYMTLQHYDAVILSVITKIQIFETDNLHELAINLRDLIHRLEEVGT